MNGSTSIRAGLAAAGLVLLVLGAPLARADAEFITVASTTSTQNSGLFERVLPEFTAATGIEVRVVAVGTGAAIRLARAGDADVLLVHHRESEQKFVYEGFGIERHPLMYNDFVLVGPSTDPAGARGAASTAAALARLAQASAVFVSRGDDSGTHKRERELWRAGGVDPSAASGGWYRETGSGMGATLNMAAAEGAYTLCDRGTWLSFQNKRDLAIVLEGDPALFNEYGIILVSPARHPHVKAQLGQRFIDWMLSDPGHAAIAAHQVGGEQLFYPLPAGRRTD